MAGMKIEIRARLKRQVFVLDLSLNLPGGVTCLYGPSGSGKTTLLQVVAGLIPCPDARIVVAGQTWQNGKYQLPTHKRRLGYVFQQPRLFPHLSVAGNIRYAQKRAKGAHCPIDLEELIDLLDIRRLLPAPITHLSGGEAQRVAIARALAAAPQLLLLDEPLASLDRRRRREVLGYLETLTTRLAIPLLYVTHERDEAARLADTLVLLENGRITAQGDVAALFSRIDLPPAREPDAATVLEATITHQDAHWGLSKLECDQLNLYVSMLDALVGARVRIGIAARDVSLTLHRAEDSSILNQIAVEVVKVEPLPAGKHEHSAGQALAQLRAGDNYLLARLTAKSAHRLGLKPGLRVIAQIKSVALLG